MMSGDEKESFIVGALVMLGVTLVFLFGLSVGHFAGEDYGRQREYWRIAAKCPAIVKEVPEK